MIQGYHFKVHYRNADGRFRSIEFRAISEINYKIVRQLTRVFSPRSVKVVKKDLLELLTLKDNKERTIWWNVALLMLEKSLSKHRVIKRPKHVKDAIRKCIQELAFKKEGLDDGVQGELPSTKLRRNARNSRGHVQHTGNRRGRRRK